MVYIILLLSIIFLGKFNKMRHIKYKYYSIRLCVVYIQYCILRAPISIQYILYTYKYNNIMLTRYFNKAALLQYKFNSFINIIIFWRNISYLFFFGNKTV